MKGITPVIATIMILLVLISIVGLAMVFLTRVQQTASAVTGEQLETLTESVVPVKIDAVNGYKIYLRTLANKSINTSKLTLYIEDRLLPVGFQILAGNDVTTINLSEGFIPQGTYRFRVTSPYYSDSALFKVPSMNAIKEPSFEGKPRKPLSVMLILDRSGSMVDDCAHVPPWPADTPCKINDAKNAANTFIDLTSMEDMTGLVTFNESAVTNHGLSFDKNSVKTAINAIISNGSTGIGFGIQNATAEIKKETRDARKIEILLTDGQENQNSNPLQRAAEAASQTIITWSTNEPADSQVEYGSTAAYGNLTTRDTTMVKKHSQNIIGLPSNETIHYRILSRDNAGNLLPTSDMILLTSQPTDITPPAVSLTSPANNSVVSGNVNVAASASDDTGVVGVQFMVNGVDVGVEDTTAPYSVSWDSLKFSNGTHTVTARARDASGNIETSASVFAGVSNYQGGSSGLVAAYSFDEGSGTVANDVSGNNNRAALSNIGWMTQPVPFGYGAYFNGINSLGAIPEISIGPSFTFMTYMNTTKNSTYQTIAVIGKYWLSMVNGTIIFFDGVSLRPYPGTLSENAWHHIALVSNGSDIGVYVDLVSRGFQTGVLGPLTASGQMGAFFTSNTYLYPLNGTLDEVRIYNKALTLSEIMGNASAALGAAPPDVTPPFVYSPIAYPPSQNAIKIYTIGLGTSIDAAMLQQIANITGSKYFYAPSGSQLKSIFTDIAYEIGDNWILTGNASIDYFTTFCYTPDTCAKFSGGVYPNTSISQRIRIAISGSYNVLDASAYIRPDGPVCANQCPLLPGETCADNDARIKIRAIDDYGNTIGESTSPWASSFGTGWVRIQKTWQTPPNTAFAVFQVEAGDCCSSCSATNVYIDDAMLEMSK